MLHLHALHIGQRIYLPHLGLGIVKELTRANPDGQGEQTFCVVQILENGLTYAVPVTQLREDPPRPLPEA